MSENTIREARITDIPDDPEAALRRYIGLWPDAPEDEFDAAVAALRALVGEAAALREALRDAANVAEHLFQMISQEDWRATGGDDGQGHHEGDYRAEGIRQDIERWKALAVSPAQPAAQDPPCTENDRCRAEEWHYWRCPKYEGVSPPPPERYGPSDPWSRSVSPPPPGAECNRLSPPPKDGPGCNCKPGTCALAQPAEEQRWQLRCGARSWQLQGHALCVLERGHKGRHVWEVQ